MGDDERDPGIREGRCAAALVADARLAIALDLAKSPVLHQPNGDLMAMAFFGMDVFTSYQHRRTRRRELLAAGAVWFSGSAWWAVSNLATVGALPL